MTENKLDTTENRRSRLVLDLPPATIRMVKVAAAMEGRTISGLIDHIIMSWLENKHGVSG